MLYKPDGYSSVVAVVKQQHHTNQSKWTLTVQILKLRSQVKIFDFWQKRALSTYRWSSSSTIKLKVDFSIFTLTVWVKKNLLKFIPQHVSLAQEKLYAVKKESSKCHIIFPNPELGSWKLDYDLEQYMCYMWSDYFLVNIIQQGLWTSQPVAKRNLAVISLLSFQKWYFKLQVLMTTWHSSD